MIKALATSVMTAAIVIPIATENAKAAPVTKTTFKDVPKSHWAYESIKQVAEKGLVTGYEDGTDKPSAQVTRAEFATFLARVFDSNERAFVSFSDVSNTHWANEAIQEGLAVGFILASGKYLHFNIPSPEYSFKFRFKTGEKYRYWASNGGMNKPGTELLGYADDGSFFYYEIPN